MKTVKSSISTACVLGMLLGGPWLVGRLVNILSWPVPVCMCVVLLAEAAVMFGIHRFRRRKVTAKNVLGIVCLVCIAVSLTVGLVSAGSYLIAYLMGEGLATSFPWYTVLAFAAAIVGPIIAITGIGWIVLHLRERKRNIKDIRILAQLLLIGTALWAVLWTALRIRHILIYPNSFGYPWHASFVYGFIYFGPWMIIEGCALFLLRHFEKKLTPEDLDPVPVFEETIPPKQPIRWDIVIRDSVVILVPLLLVAVLMVSLWDSGYALWNVVMTLSSILNVCLVIGLAAWLLYHMQGVPVGQIKRMVWVLTGLTVVAMVLWIYWYNENCLSDSFCHASNLVYTLAVGFFGPIILGETMMIALLERIENRLPMERGTGKKHFPLLVLVILSVALTGQFETMDYRDEIPMTVTKVTYHDSESLYARPGGMDHIVLTFQTEYDVYLVDGGEQGTDDESIFFKFSTRWTPLKKIKNMTVGHSVYPEGDEKYIFVYEPGGGYQLILVKNEVTGKWEFYQ